jgi:hypothetical protein
MYVEKSELHDKIVEILTEKLQDRRKHLEELNDPEEMEGFVDDVAEEVVDALDSAQGDED